jgi:uncharacterized protein
MISGKTDSFEGKLLRVSALRPIKPPGSGARPEGGSLSNARELVRMLDGEVRENHLGSHVIVRRTFPKPQVDGIEIRGLDLIAPEGPASIRDPGQWLFLDTETTGLAGGTGTYAFLVGVGWWEAGRFVVEQYFMRDHGEEPSLLAGLLDRMRERRVLVTFNGKSFDWPLLQTRYRMTRAGTVAEPEAHLDLLHPARRLWRLSLGSVALTQLETHVLGFDRGGDIPSETIPQRYFDFIRGAPPEAISEVFHHNRMDLCGLAFLALRILRILADPENSGCCPTELFGISRLLGQRGRDESAERMYRKAVEGGLPEAALRIAQRELALLARRRRDYGYSNAQWEKLLGDAVEGYRAYEQLAIYYERHEKSPQRAALLSREALVRLQEAYRAGRIPSHQYMRWHANFRHRLARLASKMGSPPSLSVHT